jgi:O-succinylbenzoic acid--CoA ligase
MLERLLEWRRDAPAPRALRCALLGGGAVPLPLLERARDAGWPLAPTYGLTEACSQVATRAPADRSAPLDAGLAPLPGLELRIRGEQGDALGPGLAGEILVRGPTLMRGYRGRPAESAAALAGGWLHTGDVGELDARGRLRVLDRRSDLFVSGGENVYPAEIEAVLLAHPAVQEAGVAALPDARFGQRAGAWIVLRAEAAAQERAALTRALEAHCRERLAAYKLPVAYRFAPELPRNATGKLLRRALPALATRAADAEGCAAPPDPGAKGAPRCPWCRSSAW